MKGLSTADLRGNDVEDLQRTLETLRSELFQNRLKQSTNQLENKSVVRKARRDIARVMTIINEKRRAVSADAGAKE